MGRMWINSILGEADKCYIPNILLLSVPCHHIATGSLELCTLNHKFTHYTQTHTMHIKTKETGTNIRKHRESLVGLTPSCLTFLHHSAREGGAAVRRALWVAVGGGKELRWVDGGQNHKCGMSHGQTEWIYDWSGSTSAAWCWGFRMSGMGVRSDSGFSLYTLSGICSLCDWPKAVWREVCGLLLSGLLTSPWL